MDLPTMRARVRTDLRDTDSSDQRWTDAELDRQIARAVEEISLAAPRELTTDFSSDGTRTIDLAGVTGLLTVGAVEYPVGQDPQQFVMFSRWGTKLTVLGQTAPAAGQTIRLYYGAKHTLDAVSSTLPLDLEDVVATGAVAYAALAWAAHAANRITIGGADVWRSYQRVGEERMAAFSAAMLRRRGSVKARRLYRPAQQTSLNNTAQF